MSAPTGASDVPGMVRRLVAVLSDGEVAALSRKWSASPLRVATVCSGTDAPILGLDMLRDALYARSGRHKIGIEHVFSCEKVKFKRDFVAATTRPALLFQDVTEVAQGEGMCHDGVRRLVPEHFNVLISGTECVDFSSLSTAPKGLRGGGRSAITFWATLELAKARTPAVVLLENVATCPARDMEQAFAEAGYVAAHTKVCTSDYLLPQSRSRCYFLFLLAGKARFLPSSSEETWIHTMKRLGPRRPSFPEEIPLRWTDFLLEESDTPTAPTGKKKGRRGKPLSESLGSKWLAEVQAIEEKEGLQKYGEPGGRPYSDATAHVAALASLPDRAKMRLDVQCKRALQAGIDPLTVPLLWNPAQQLRFTDAGFGTDGRPRPLAPCVTPKHEWVVSARRAPLRGAEALALQGIRVPWEALAKFDEKQLRDLAGNAMSTTVAAAALLATFLTAELVEERRSSSEKRAASTDDEQGQGVKRSRIVGVLL